LGRGQQKFKEHLQNFEWPEEGSVKIDDGQASDQAAF
jgi:hypothetical protein